MIDATFDVLLLAAVIYATILGGTPERLAAAIFFVARAATRAFEAETVAGWAPIQWSLSVIDAGVLLTLLAITVWYNRWWTIFATVTLTIAGLSHVARVRHVDFSPHAYELAESLPSWIAVIALAAGTYAQSRRARRGN